MSVLLFICRRSCFCYFPAAFFSSFQMLFYLSYKAIIKRVHSWQRFTSSLRRSYSPVCLFSSWKSYVYTTTHWQLFTQLEERCLKNIIIWSRHIKQGFSNVFLQNSLSYKNFIGFGNFHGFYFRLLKHSFTKQCFKWSKGGGYSDRWYWKGKENETAKRAGGSPWL